MIETKKEFTIATTTDAINNIQEIRLLIGGKFKAKTFMYIEATMSDSIIVVMRIKAPPNRQTLIKDI